jgi:hypothetical protein
MFLLFLLLLFLLLLSSSSLSPNTPLPIFLSLINLEPQLYHFLLRIVQLLFSGKLCAFSSDSSIANNVPAILNNIR